jgi:hypothetical protein
MPNKSENFRININEKGEVEIDDKKQSVIDGKKIIDLSTAFYVEVLKTKECPVVDPPITPMCLQCKIEITGD